MTEAEMDRLVDEVVLSQGKALCELALFAAMRRHPAAAPRAGEHLTRAADIVEGIAHRLRVLEGRLTRE